MIKQLILFFAFSVPFFLQAQVTVSVQLPSSGMIQKDQLWNLVLANNGGNTMELTILLNLQDAATGQTLLSAGTHSILLGKGVKVLNVRDVQPVQYNYGTIGLTGNYLPLGTYLACYTITRVRGDIVEAVANECARLNIVPLSPPLLNTPADKSMLQNALPQLTWLPPSPLNMFDNLNYDITVSEVLQGQSPTDAILNNMPVYLKTHVKASYENYPSSYSKLEAGKTYAWQVTARNGQNYSAPTEVWTFSIAKDSNIVKAINSSYILLKNKDESGVSYIVDKNLNIKYYSFDKEHEATVRFIGANGKVMQEKKQKIIYGDNFFVFRLNNSFDKRKVYKVEIRDQQNNLQTASFSIN